MASLMKGTVPNILRASLEFLILKYGFEETEAQALIIIRQLEESDDDEALSFTPQRRTIAVRSETRLIEPEKKAPFEPKNGSKWADIGSDSED